jgi:hypothetical protein
MAKEPNDPRAGAWQLPMGLTGFCQECGRQGHLTHTTMDAVRHDAAEHVVWVHGDRRLIERIELRFVTQEERDVRARSE